jgi:hypothetical protein
MIVAPHQVIVSNALVATTDWGDFADVWIGQHSNASSRLNLGVTDAVA